MVVAGEASANPASPLAAEGVEEAGIIVPQATSDGFAPGPITGWWPHGFNLRQLTLQSSAYVPMHARLEAEVLFIQSGTVEISWADGSLFLGAGDTLSVPIGLPHAFRNTASVPAIVFVVRGGESPAAADLHLDTVRRGLIRSLRCATWSTEYQAARACCPRLTARC